MAADQRKRRLNAVSAFCYESWEKQKAKKKNFGSLQYDFSLNPHISLKWDEKEKRVVAKGEQIGISWRHLTSCITCPPRKNNILADIVAIPKDIFELKDLKELLSLQVWKSHLTEKERKYLMQFLPEGSEPEQVVQLLLTGDNFHFGNPFLKWASSLCSGGLHPDVVCHHEQSFRANKKEYYAELQSYHDNMIGTLQILKEKCAHSKDPETEIVQMMRSRRHAEENISSDDNELTFRDPDENIGAASESCSWTADEKACSSDNMTLSMVKGAELKKRGNNKNEKPVVYSDGLKTVSRLKKGDKLQKLNVNYNDGSKYMSYVKISKKQHELVMSMKQSGNSIQTRALNRVLGNLDNFHVKPYEMFEREEENRILEHWSNLANKDLPVAFANWRKRQLGRWQIGKSLCKEMEEKLKNLMEDEEEISGGITVHQQDDVGAAHQPHLEENLESDSSPMEDHSLQISSLNVNPMFSPTDLNAEGNPIASEMSEYHVTSDTVEGSQNRSLYPGNHNSVDVHKTEGLSHSSVADAWPPASMPDSYCHPTSSNVEYPSSSELSLGRRQEVEEQSARMIDLKSNMPREDPTKDLLHQQAADMPFFSSYQTRDRNELLHSLLKRDNYYHEQRSGLDFHPTTSMLMESSQFPGHFREQLQPSFALEHRQKGQSDLYMHQNIQENIFSDNSRYTNPRQEHFSIDMQDWSNSRVSAPIHSHLGSGEMLNHNWFSSENRTRDGWSGSECGVFRNLSLGNGGSGDQSLYSVLSQSNNLHPLTTFDAVGSNDKFIPSNYGEDMGSEVIPRTSNPLPQAVSPLHYLSGHDATAAAATAAAATALKNSSMGWMSLPRQTSLHDPTGKSFSKLWNQ
ncbi:hypothetical protein Nepgr_008730 [Nepenthes gracilis]|uniref:DEUBAD domain-containing protein n=1 Tax=Nepenthes gracilis TaxID=150966 RepID=A0AAD3S976_NEPGR|nr:hypothetical protein Nepgr_008730 [Nepenthes gracilis]